MFGKFRLDLLAGLGKCLGYGAAWVRKYGKNRKAEGFSARQANAELHP